MRELKFDLNDIVLYPAEESEISSRSECEIKYTENNKLPLMASPMDTVVSEENYGKYIEQGIIPCIPRGNSDKHLIATSSYFQSFGLCEIETQLKHYEKECNRPDIWVPLNNDAFYNYPNVLIDIANGHMSKLIPLVGKIKKNWPHLILMVGNVANPETFVNLGNAGADYVRISIGTGCFIPGQNIKLKKEEKNIENIDIGDEVLTHSNEYKKVINKFEYETNEEIYEINDIKCTKNHEFFIIEKEYENIVNDENLLEYAKWISAKDLDINKHLLIQY